MNEPLKEKTKYTASVFKVVEFNHGVSFVSKELYDSIGKNDKVYGMELFEKEDIQSAVEWLKFKLQDTGIYEGQEWQRVADLFREAFPDLNL